MNPRVRFEDEADAEYRLAGRWYEGRRDHLGLEFFDAVDAAISQPFKLRRSENGPLEGGSSCLSRHLLRKGQRAAASRRILVMFMVTWTEGPVMSNNRYVV